MLTVVFATHNGAETLPTMLDGLTRLEAPRGGWKLVAVDNASTDATPEILAQFADRLPLQILRHAELGRSRALNHALDHIEGELVIFTDDDVVVRPDWLKRYRWLGKRAPGFSVFGGRIVPRWPAPVRAAILKGIPLAPAYAVHPPGVGAGPVRPIMIWGGNMAVRPDIFDRGHRFKESAGVAGTSGTMGEDTEFAGRLRARGFGCMFDNQIVIEHLIQPYQLTLKWLMGRAFRHGRGMFQNNRDMRRLNGADSTHSPDRLFAGFAARAGQIALAGLKGDHAGFYRACWRFQFWRGWCYEARLARPAAR